MAGQAEADGSKVQLFGGCLLLQMAHAVSSRALSILWNFDKGLSVRLDADGTKRLAQKVVCCGHGHVSEFPATVAPNLGEFGLQLSKADLQMCNIFLIF